MNNKDIWWQNPFTVFKVCIHKWGITITDQFFTLQIISRQDSTEKPWELRWIIGANFLKVPLQKMFMSDYTLAVAFAASGAKTVNDGFDYAMNAFAAENDADFGREPKFLRHGDSLKLLCSEGVSGENGVCLFLNTTIKDAVTALLEKTASSR